MQAGQTQVLYTGSGEACVAYGKMLRDAEIV